MMKYRIVGPARILNWLLAVAIAASIVGAIALFESSPLFASALCALWLLLLVGVVFHVPLAYLGLATLSFMGLAASLNRTNLLLAVFNATTMIVALIVRSRIVVRVAESHSTSQPKSSGQQNGL